MSKDIRLAFIPKNIILEVNAISKRAESEGMYCVDSDMRGATYICGEGKVIITTPMRGYLRMTEQDARVLADELPGILADLDYRRCAGIR